MTSILKKLAAEKAKNKGGIVQSDKFFRIPVDKLLFDAEQPRQAFHAMDGVVDLEQQMLLEDLAASMKANGQFEPIEVEERVVDDETKYLIIFGERRSRAAMLLGWEYVDGKIASYEDGGQKLVVQLVENVQRADLSDMEIAETLRRLRDEHGKTGKDLEVETGMNRGRITKLLVMASAPVQDSWIKTGIAAAADTVYRLTLLPEDLQEEIRSRASMPESDYQRLETPITREALLHYERIAKRRKEAEAEEVLAEKRAAEAATTPAGAGGNGAGGEGGWSGGLDAGDPTTAAVAQFLANEEAGESSDKVASKVLPMKGAALSEDDAETDDGKFSMPSEMVESLRGNSSDATTVGGHPVRAEATFSLIKKLMADLLVAAESEGDVGFDPASLEQMRIEVRFPNEVADFVCRRLGNMGPVEGRRSSLELQDILAKYAAGDSAAA